MIPSAQQCLELMEEYEMMEHIRAHSIMVEKIARIITRGLQNARDFASRVDSAAVFINTSTRFNDGGQFGMGAEIGISTGKLHARGPMALPELTSYKFIVHGEGQVRE